MIEKMSRRLFLKIQGFLALYGLGMSGCKKKTDSADIQPIQASNTTALKNISSSVNSIVYNMPFVICGAIVNGQPNFNVLGNCSIISDVSEKPVVYISSNRNHYTNIGIREHGEFSLCFPKKELIAKADYCGVVSGHNVNKSGVFPVQYGMLSYAPLVKECMYCLSCRVIKQLSVHTMEVFFGEVVEHFIPPSESDGVLVNVKSCNTLTYGPGFEYCVLSDCISTTELTK